MPFSVESRNEFLKSIKTLNLPSDESANYNRLEEEIKKVRIFRILKVFLPQQIDDAKKNISEMQNHFENSWNALIENGLTISNDFAFYRIPNTNWIFVRPLQMPTKCKGFHLPVIPEEQVDNFSNSLFKTISNTSIFSTTLNHLKNLFGMHCQQQKIWKNQRNWKIQ